MVVVPWQDVWKDFLTKDVKKFGLVSLLEMVQGSTRPHKNKPFSVQKDEYARKLHRFILQMGPGDAERHRSLRGAFWGKTASPSKVYENGQFFGGAPHLIPTYMA